MIDSKLILEGVARGGDGSLTGLRLVGDDVRFGDSSSDSWWTGTGKYREDAIAVGWGRLVGDMNSLPGHCTHCQGP